MLLILDRQAELEPIDEQAEDEIMHLDRSRKANGFPHQPFDPGAQREMFPLQLLGPPLADHVLVPIQVSVIGSPAISVEAVNAQRCEQRFECQQCLILTPPEDIGHDPARLMIKGSPQPAWLLLAADKGPHLVQLRLRYLVDRHRGCSLTTRPQGRVHLVERPRFFLSVVMTVVGLTLKTRAVSRMPLPLSAMSTICCLTSGNRPVW